MAECGQGPGGSFTLGQSYQVPCVRWVYFGKLDWWPVLGPLHSDSKIIGFEPDHYHVDPRFLSRDQYSWLTSRVRTHRSDQPWYGFPLHDARIRPSSEAIASIPTLKRRKYQREHGVIAWSRARWMKELQDAYAHACMKQGVCPHQGAPLKGIAVVDGVVTCPLHGLKWVVATGRLLRRVESRVDNHLLSDAI